MRSCPSRLTTAPTHTVPAFLLYCPCSWTCVCRSLEACTLTWSSACCETSTARARRRRRSSSRWAGRLWAGRLWAGRWEGGAAVGRTLGGGWAGHCVCKVGRVCSAAMRSTVGWQPCTSAGGATHTCQRFLPPLPQISETVYPMYKAFIEPDLKVSTQGAARVAHDVRLGSTRCMSTCLLAAGRRRSGQGARSP